MTQINKAEKLRRILVHPGGSGLGLAPATQKPVDFTARLHLPAASLIRKTAGKDVHLIWTPGSWSCFLREALKASPVQRASTLALRKRVNASSSRASKPITRHKLLNRSTTSAALSRCHANDSWGTNT